TGGFQNRFAMPAETNSAIYKETSALRSEELHRLFQQHGAMGRAHAPQRRSHLHRPVISFKDLFVFCSVSFVLWLTLHKVQSTKYKALNTKPRNRSFVFFRVWIGEHASFELVELPNFQIGQVTHDSYVAKQF